MIKAQKYSTERIAIADRFILEYNLSDDDICQNIYLAALEADSQVDQIQLYNTFTKVLAKFAEDQKFQREYPSGLLINIRTADCDAISNLLRVLM